MRKKAIILCSMIVALVIVSCEKKYFEPVVLDPNLPVSFSGYVEPLFQKECASSGCHSGAVAPNLETGKSYQALMDGAYIDTLNPGGSILMIKLNTNMPPQKLPAAEINKVLLWIEQGAPQN